MYVLGTADPIASAHGAGVVIGPRSLQAPTIVLDPENKPRTFPHYTCMALPSLRPLEALYKYGCLC